MEYTKGEWRASHPLYGATDIVVDVTPQRTDMLASIKWGRSIPEDQQRANAQLIASAPDLYEALKALKLRFRIALEMAGRNQDMNDLIERELEDTNKALLKAEGNEEGSCYE